MPPGSPSRSHNIWTEEHAAPTLADVVLPPRRRLRDGTRASSPRSKRARTRSTRSGTSTDDLEPLDEEQHRRLPRLRTRERATPRSPSPEPPQASTSLSPPPPPQAQLSEEGPPHTSRDSPTPHTSLRDHDQDAFASLDDPGIPGSPGSATDTSGDEGPRRFTAAEKGKGRAMPPEVIEIPDDEPGMDESIQILDHTPAPPRPVKEVKSAIAEDDALSAFSKLTVYVYGS